MKNFFSLKLRLRWWLLCAAFLVVGGAVGVASLVPIERLAAARAEQNQRTYNLTLHALRSKVVFGSSYGAKHAADFLPKIYRPATPPPATFAGPLAHVVFRVPTTDPVIFITIDDGLYTNEPALALMQERGVVASLFLNDYAVNKHPDHIKRWQQSGSAVQNHTLSHPQMPELPPHVQKHEICENSNRLHAVYGKQPTLFRPPYGEYNDATRRAAAECGIKTLVWWSVVVNGGLLHYQSTDHLRPGDIVLLHFTPNLRADLQALFAAADAQNLQIGRLEDWLY